MEKKEKMKRNVCKIGQQKKGKMKKNAHWFIL